MIRCGGCGCTVSGEGFASLQERIARKGWMKDADDRYYCKKCTAFHSAEASSVNHLDLQRPGHEMPFDFNISGQ